MPRTTLQALFRFFRGERADTPAAEGMLGSENMEPGLAELGDFAAMNFEAEAEEGNFGAWHDRQWQESNLADWFRHRSVELANRAERRTKTRAG